MGRAIGMIETKGLIGSIEAADAMLKAADVTLIKQEKVDAALVTVLVQGDVSAIQAAIEVGKAAAARVGELVSSHVIPHPDQEVKDVLLRSIKTKESINKDTEFSPQIKTTNKKKQESLQTPKEKLKQDNNTSDES